MQLFQLFKAIPVTWMMLFVSGLVWAADNGVSQQLQIEFHQAQMVLGAESTFGLWAGHWWLAITTAFHHGDIIHLLMNSSTLWFLGRLLETRMGSWRYALFSLTGLAVAGGVQSMWSDYVGLSGMLYAQFGLIWAWRHRDKWLQTYVSDSQIQFGVVMLFVFVALTWAKLLRIGNACHFGGCIYGYLIGQVYFGSPRARFWKPVVLASHLLLIPMYYFLVYPFWNGTYHWRRGDLAVDPSEQRMHYENAIYWDPNQPGPWVNRAVGSLRQGKLQEAWVWILRGLRYHPSYQKAIDLARQLWLQFPNRAERHAAREELRKIFGADAPAWEDMLLDDAAVDEVKPAQRGPSGKLQGADIVEEPEPLDVPTPPFTLPPRAIDEIRRPSRRISPPDPNAPGSAEEGRSA